MAKDKPKRQRMMLSNVPAGLRQRCKALAALADKEGTVTLDELKAELEARDKAGAIPD